MKRGTPDHPKIYRLMELAGVDRPTAIGYLELLWHWAGKYAIQGDVGKWDDATIAQACGVTVVTRRDRFLTAAAKLVTALTESGWLDRQPAPHRLVIHDIKDHADNTWRQNLEDAGLTWWDGTPPRREKVGRPKSKNSRETPETSNFNSSETPQPEPEPEPLYITENSKSKTRSLTDAPSPPPDPPPLRQSAWLKDSGFCQFIDGMAAAGAPVTTEDRAEAAWEWGKLDFEQRKSAIDSVLKRTQAGAWDDPAFIPRPKNYLKKHEWNRPIVLPRQDHRSQMSRRESAIQRALESARREAKPQ
jgi:hypothetical protein